MKRIQLLALPFLILISTFYLAGCKTPEREEPLVPGTTAVEIRDTKAATKYATTLLEENATRKKWPAWQYGNIIHDANQILGLVALQEGRIVDAKRFLIAAGNTPGSPQLNSFGPDMVLAQELLNIGEQQTVIQYLDLVARFWAYPTTKELEWYAKKHPKELPTLKKMKQNHLQQINEWKKQIKANKKPKLHNLGMLHFPGML